MGFDKKFCDLCGIIRWFYNGHCTDHSDWPPAHKPNVAGLRNAIMGVRVPEVPDVPVKPLDRSKKVRPIQPMLLRNGVPHVECARCPKVVPLTDTILTRVRVGTGEKDIEKVEAFFDPNTGDTWWERSVSRRQFPIIKSLRVCSSCLRVNDKNLRESEESPEERKFSRFKPLNTRYTTSTRLKRSSRGRRGKG